MKFSGTSLISLKDILKNLKKMAGTCTITRSSFDANESKICSYSYINKTYKLSWNECLNKADLHINRTLPIPIKQGRKPKIKNIYRIECLSCSIEFDSIDPKTNRVCRKCKHNLDFRGDDIYEY